MKFANPRTVWKKYLFDAFELAKKNKKELTVFVHYHANNSVPHDYKINETAAKFDFDFSKEDTVEIDDMTTACSGKINGLIYVFNFITMTYRTFFNRSIYRMTTFRTFTHRNIKGKVITSLDSSNIKEFKILLLTQMSVKIYMNCLPAIGILINLSPMKF